MNFLKYRKRAVGSVLLGTGLVTATAIAAITAFSPAEKLSENELAAKTKLVRMGSGWLVAPYGDTVPGANDVYDVKADAVRPARDVFVKVCNPAANESNCSLASDWSAPVNLSNTALLSSISTDWQEDNPEGTITPFYGDSEKPNVFVAGSFAMVSWIDKYCPGDNQKMISYTERDGITVPFSCVYAAYTNNVGSGNWTTIQLTDGTRDAKSDVNKGLSYTAPEASPVGQWIIGWQEDPRGLQIGGADGPGDGASGASVTHGTDIWYTYTEDLMSGSFAEPVRITDNYLTVGQGGNTSPVFHPSDPTLEIEDLERGKTGAARPNFMLVAEGSAGSATPTAVLAYEESKGADRTDSGKFIRYHQFTYNTPPPSTPGEPNGEPLSGEPGCIISDPLENSRRVRFVAQPSASPTGGLRMGVFWRQGLPTEGGPADIMSRVGIKTADAGSTGLRPEDMVPAVDPGCEAVDYAAAKLLTSVPGENLSSNTVPWSPVSCEVGAPVPPPTNTLLDTTMLNPYEDARAHRAAIVGEDFYLGYSYTKDWALSTYSDLENYDFYLRHYNAVSDTWTDAQNVSNLPDKSQNVKEPRLVKTPGTNTTKCPNPADPSDPANTDPEMCQNKNTLIVAWGTETNVYSHVESSVEGDIYYSRTTDKAATFEDFVVVPGIGINNRFESQLRPSPSGNIIWAVWNEADNTPAGGKHAMLSVSDGSGIVVPPGDGFDLSIPELNVPESVKLFAWTNSSVTITNTGPEASGPGTVTVTGVDSISERSKTWTFSFTDLAEGESQTFNFLWTTNYFTRTYGSTVNWTATVTPDAADSNPANNTAEAATAIVR